MTAVLYTSDPIGAELKRLTAPTAGTAIRTTEIPYKEGAAPPKSSWSVFGR